MQDDNSSNAVWYQIDAVFRKLYFDLMYDVSVIDWAILTQ